MCLSLLVITVSQKKISAHTQPEVTLAMIATIASGKSAVGVLAQQANASCVSSMLAPKVRLRHWPHRDWIKYINSPVAQGTHNICIQDAMTIEEAQRAQDIGRQTVRASISEGADVLVIGEGYREHHTCGSHYLQDLGHCT